jgi:hypothetical protein
MSGLLTQHRPSPRRPEVPGAGRSCGGASWPASLPVARPGSGRVACALRSGFACQEACAVPKPAHRLLAGVFCDRQAALRYSPIRPFAVTDQEFEACRVPNSATGLDLGFYAARSYSPSRTPAVLPRRQDQEDSHGLGGWLRLARCPVSRDRGPGSGQGPSPRRFFRDAQLVRAPAPRHRSQGAGLSPSPRPGTSWKLRNLRRWLFFLALAQYPAKCVITGHPRD